MLLVSNGSVSATTMTATTFSGTATNANFVAVNNTSSNTNYPVNFSSLGTLTPIQILNNNNILINPSSGTLTLPNATVTGTLTATLTGNASSATLVSQQTSATSSTCYPLFSNTTSGGVNIQPSIKD